jgi:hypothetical protein
MGAAIAACAACVVSHVCVIFAAVVAADPAQAAAEGSRGDISRALQGSDLVLLLVSLTQAAYSDRLIACNY